MTRNGETIFLTGFPGFIAGRLVARLATPETKFLLLVQSHLVERAHLEIASIANRANVSPERFQIVEGDITQDNLGMSAEDYASATRETTHVFHLAAIYDLAVELPLAMSVNVEGTRRVNDFAQAAHNSGNLHRYHYISTCYVAGLRTGLIKETELQHNAGFRNHYEATKYLAELEVEKLKERVPLTVYRPSVVCGDSQTGETAKYDGIYYLIKYLLRRPKLLSLVNIGNTEVRLNIVPVDFVIEAISTLAFDERATNQTLQIADPAPLTTAELFDEIARTLASQPSRVRLPAALVRTAFDLPLSESLSKMPRVAAPYFFLKQLYDTAIADSLLEPHGVRCPTFSTYVDALVRFVVEHPHL